MTTTTAAATLSFNGQVAILPCPIIGDNMSQSASKKARKFAKAVHAALLGMGLAAGTATITLPEGNQVELPIEWGGRDCNNGYKGGWIIAGWQADAIVMAAVLGRRTDIYDSSSYLRKFRTHGNGAVYTRPA